LSNDPYFYAGGVVDGGALMVREVPSVRPVTWRRIGRRSCWSWVVVTDEPDDLTISAVYQDPHDMISLGRPWSLRSAWCLELFLMLMTNCSPRLRRSSARPPNGPR